MRWLKNKWIWVGALPLAGAIWLLAQPNPLRAAARVPASYFAKSYCSCLFVMEHPREYCKNMIQAAAPVPAQEVVIEAKTVRAKVLGSTAVARLTSQRNGCRLL